VYTAD